jgi:uncharacterized protein (DUF433 family)
MATDDANSRKPLREKGGPPVYRFLPRHHPHQRREADGDSVKGESREAAGGPVHEPVPPRPGQLDGSLRLAIDRIHTRIGAVRESNMAVLDWSQCPAVERIPGKVSGAWVLRGTRMPVSTIFENLEAGANIDDILQWFEGLDREQVKAVIDFVARSLETPAPAADARPLRLRHSRSVPPIPYRPYRQDGGRTRLEHVIARQLAQCG